LKKPVESSNNNIFEKKIEKEVILQRFNNKTKINTVKRILSNNSKIEKQIN